MISTNTATWHRYAAIEIIFSNSSGGLHTEREGTPANPAQTSCHPISFRIQVPRCAQIVLLAREEVASHQVDRICKWNISLARQEIGFRGHTVFMAAIFAEYEKENHQKPRLSLRQRQLRSGGQSDLPVAA